MKVEVLYFDGCPNHEVLMPHLRKLLISAGVAADIDLVAVEDPEGGVPGAGETRSDVASL